MKKRLITLLAAFFIIAVTPVTVIAYDPNGDDPVRPHPTRIIIPLDIEG